VERESACCRGPPPSLYFHSQVDLPGAILYMKAESPPPPALRLRDNKYIYVCLGNFGVLAEWHRRGLSSWLELPNFTAGRDDPSLPGPMTEPREQPSTGLPPRLFHASPPLSPLMGAPERIEARIRRLIDVREVVVSGGVDSIRLKSNVQRETASVPISVTTH
jgi:hypothetical protein